MSSGYRYGTVALVVVMVLLSYWLMGVPVIIPLIMGRKEMEDELKKLMEEKKRYERREQSHSRTIADLSMKVENLEWQIKLAEPFIRKQLFNMETLQASVDLGVEMKEDIGGPSAEYSMEREGARWMDMVVYSTINADRDDANTIFVFIPLTEGLRERNILLNSMESMSKDTFLIKREEGNMIHFAEKCATRMDGEKISGKTFALLLRVARFQEQRPIAIFENNTHFMGLLKEEAERCPGRSAYEVMYPRHIIEWVKGCAEATLVDSKSFNNDPLAFFLIRRALQYTAEGRKVDVLDVIVNNRFIQQKRHNILIEALASYGHME